MLQDRSALSMTECESVIGRHRRCAAGRTIFDIATLTTLPARAADATASINAGLSPGDKYYDEPYFYVSIYPEPDPRMLPTLPTLGHWHERDFIAAVARAESIVAAGNQQAATDHFLQAAIDAAIKGLDHWCLKDIGLRPSKRKFEA